jgi:hypothetical protein
MSTDRRALPDQADADSLAELIADARAVPVPQLLDLTGPRPVRLPRPRPGVVVRIPEATASLVAGYSDYGS